MARARPLIGRYLDPADALAELLFGLIMALTITLGAGVITSADGVEASGVLLAALGCNLAWGIIDAVFYLMSCRYERVRHAVLIAAIRAAPDEAAALGQARQFLEPRIEALGDADDRERLVRGFRVAAQHGTPSNAIVTMPDLRAAGVIVVLVSTCALPAALPFLLVSDPVAALRLSNLVLVALLFAAGFLWSRALGGSGWRSGAVCLVLGLAMVAIAIALGG